MRKLNDPFYEPLRSWLEEIQKDLATKEAAVRAQLDEQEVAHRNAMAEAEAKFTRNTEVLCDENERLREKVQTLTDELNTVIATQKKDAREFSVQITKLRVRLETQDTENRKKIAETEVAFKHKIENLNLENDRLRNEIANVTGQLTAQARETEYQAQQVSTLRGQLEVQSKESKAKLLALESAAQKKETNFSIEAEKLKTELLNSSSRVDLLTHKNVVLSSKITELESKLNANQEAHQLKIDELNRAYKTKLRSTELSYQTQIDTLTIGFQKKSEAVLSENAALKAEISALTSKLNSTNKKNNEATAWIDSLVQTNAYQQTELKKFEAAARSFKAMVESEKNTLAEANRKIRQEQTKSQIYEEKMRAFEKELKAYKEQMKAIGNCVKDFSTKEETVSNNSLEDSQKLLNLIAEERIAFETITRELKEKLGALEQSSTPSTSALSEIRSYDLSKT